MNEINVCPMYVGDTLYHFCRIIQNNFMVSLLLINLALEDYLLLRFLVYYETLYLVDNKAS